MVIKAIIFDCFGVLITSGHALLYRDYPRLMEEIKNLQYQTDSGKITRPQFDNMITRLTGLSSQEVEERYWMVNKFNQPVMDLVRELKSLGRYKIGMLSNISRDWMDSSLPVFEKENLFDTIILSGDVGMTKPDPEIFKLMAERLGVLSNECIMIDDLPVNINGAKQAGMHGIVYVSESQARAELSRLLESLNA